MPVVVDAIPIAWNVGYRLSLPDLPAGASPPSAGFPLLVALHGFGDTAARLEERLPALAGAPFAVLYPDGPFPVEIRREHEPTRVGASWYQYTGDQDAFRTSLRFVADHLERLVRHVAAAHPVDPGRIALLGYSQGGYVAGTMALWRPDRYLGLVAIGTRLKLEVVDDVRVASDLPVLVVHGKRDRAIPFERQMEMVTALRAGGVQVEVHAHEGGHGLRPERSEVVRSFVDRLLDPECGPPRPDRTR